MAGRSYWELAAQEVYPSVSALKRAAKGRPLSVYLGIDPTSSVIHLGHAVALRVLRSLQEEGHRITLLLGTFTSLVGDPSGRDTSRPVLTEQGVAANTRTYKEQVSRILDLKQTTFRENSEWFTDPRRMGTLRTFLELGTKFTAAQLWERDMFQERQKKAQPVTLTEFTYPILQAYDFVALNADAQVGGTDQTFNMLAGRELAKKLGEPEKFVITTKLLRGTDGRKMSKSYSNFIGVTEAPGEMFGALMSIRDELLPEYFELAAGVDPEEREIFDLVRTKPRDAKAKMAYEVVAFYHGAAAAELAVREFDRQFKGKEAPSTVAERTPSVTGSEKVAFYLVDLGLASSKSEAMRLIEQGGVTVDGAKITDPFAVITPHDGMLIQVGKRRYVKVKL